MKKPAVVVAALIGLAGCMGPVGPDPLPGDEYFLMAYPKNAPCTLVGDGIRVEQVSSAIGANFIARGPMDGSTIVCQTETGEQLRTTGHRKYFTRSDSVTANLRPIRVGETSFFGTTVIGTQTYEFFDNVVLAK
ncbi:hypothetical protein [Shimia ponticola]|uniref:hypothetical protein n=1 Tax=Shimia ponticola TaxID=2582893 RepID=UPI0011BDB879|nr:hypothetical protein [Shimia ponticola]